MFIRILSAGSSLIALYGVYSYLRCLFHPSNDAAGRAMGIWHLIVWAAIGLIPALIAAGLVFARYADLDSRTRLIGLIPAGVLLVPLFSFTLVITAIAVFEAARRRGDQRRRKPD